jgi:Uma2 family endonuclease
MSSATIESGPSATPPFPIHRFSVAEYWALYDAGLLTEDNKVELLDGWIVPKMTKYPPHDGTIDLLNELLREVLPPGWFPRLQNVVQTRDSDPEPDLAVVRGKAGDYRRKHPTGEDVGLVIEVADSTVGRDRKKAAIYARADIPHYWIVNLDDRQIEVYSQPTGAGRKRVYRDRVVLRGKASLEVKLAQKVAGSLTVREILG